MSVKRQTTEEAAQQAQEFGRKLAALDLDGPVDMRGGDGMFGALIGATQVAVCTRCGAMVLLGDPLETEDGRTIERSVKLHTEWHARADA